MSVPSSLQFVQHFPKNSHLYKIVFTFAEIDNFIFVSSPSIHIFLDIIFIFISNVFPGSVIQNTWHFLNLARS